MNDTRTLIERSKDDSSDKNLPLIKSTDKLVELAPSPKLELRPIWLDPIDNIEGPLYQKYIISHPKYNKIFVRETVKDMLLKASESLPGSLMLIVRAGHRPLEVQEQLLEMLKLHYLKQNPGATEKQCIDFARTYVADPSITFPPHCCGSAVDIDVYNNKSKKLLDFGCPINTDEPVAFLHSHLINGEQRENRLMLLGAMLGAGFASFSNEWWHFSYGDTTWANFYKKKSFKYDLIEPKL